LQDLRALILQLQRDNEQLKADNERLRLANERLRQQLEAAQRQAKRQAAPFSKGPPKNHPKPPGRKAGPGHGRHGHRPAPAAAAINETLDAPLPDACPRCGGAVCQTDTVQQFQTEIPRRPLLRQFNVQRGRCRACGKQVQGRHPLQTSDALGAAASQLGPDAQAAIVELNKTAGLSHGKIVDCFATLFGISLTRGASAQVVLRAGRRLAPTYAAIEEQVRAAPQLSVDETGWRIGGRSAWLHAWVAPTATCYHIDPGRSADALERVIGRDWDGVLIHDGFASYDRFERATHQQCLAHVLRRCRELLADATRGAVRFPRALVALFTEAIHRRNEYLRGAAATLAGARDDFEERLLGLLVPDRAVPAYETLRWHLWDHFGEWLAFLGDVRIEATNWPAEQALRPAVVNRKVWGGNRTEAGAQAQGILVSVLRTCRQQAVAPLEFVSQTLCAFGNHRASPPVLFQPR
jgi:transposase